LNGDENGDGAQRPSPEFARILDGLGDAQRQASSRSVELLRLTDLTVELPLPGDVIVPADAPTGATFIPARLRRLARPVATVVVTMVLVLGGWLGVLEPLLGSRPVVVTDDGMSPALRVGDVAFVEAPSGPLVSGAIVAVRVDGRVVVSRLIEREPAADGAGPEARDDAPIVVRDDADDLTVRTVVARDELLGVIGAAVPRIALPVVWLRSPGTTPLGALFVLLVLGVTVLGAADAWRERTARRA
jgi:hypothetical protein